MDTPTNAVAHEHPPRGERDGQIQPHWEQLRAALSRELAQHGQRQGYIESHEWQTALARMADLDVPPDAQAQVRAELSASAAKHNWLFPEEAPPEDPSRRIEVLVGRARAHVRRTPLITQAYLSALLAVGGTWGLAHDEVARALAHASVVEHWRVDWEIACEMEGLLGAEQALDRQRLARSQAQRGFEQRGRKGWLSESDLVYLYSSLRGQGVADGEVRELMASLQHDANARRWAWDGPTSPSPASDANLQLLVDKVAEQVRRTGHVQEGFRQAIIGEAVGANVQTDHLREAIQLRGSREHWSVAFDPQGELDDEDPSAWWPVLRERLRAARIPTLDPVVSSGLRMAMPLLIVMTVISANRPVVAPPTLNTAQAGTASTLAAAAPAVVQPVVDVPASTPAPPRDQPQTLVVAHTDGAGARLRTAPATGSVARLLSDGTAVVVIGSEMQVGGTAWAQVRAPDGTPGWMAADFLSPTQADPSLAG